MLALWYIRLNLLLNYSSLLRQWIISYNKLKAVMRFLLLLNTDEKEVKWSVSGVFHSTYQKPPRGWKISEKKRRRKLKESTMLMENGVEVVVNVQLAQIKMYYFKAMAEGMIFVGKVFFCSFLSYIFLLEKFLSLAKFTEKLIYKIAEFVASL